MNIWKSIWDGKSLDDLNLTKDEFELFCDLKKADGFDVNVKNEQAYYMAFYQDFLKMYDKVQSLTKHTIQSVYEVGCGSGVNLFLFRNRLKNSRIGGIDYSQSLIDIAGKVTLSSDLVCGEAIQTDPGIKYDLVMADSVFQYFSDLDYAGTVLRKMLQKADKLVYLGELHNKDSEAEWLAARRKAMENYDEIYKGLGKLFYRKKWLEDIAAEFGKSVLFTASENPEYWNSQYIFNCYMY